MKLLVEHNREMGGKDREDATTVTGVRTAAPGVKGQGIQYSSFIVMAFC